MKVRFTCTGLWQMDQNPVYNVTGNLEIKSFWNTLIEKIAPYKQAKERECNLAIIFRTIPFFYPRIYRSLKQYLRGKTIL